jgi:hypothetical protein
MPKVPKFDGSRVAPSYDNRYYPSFCREKNRKPYLARIVIKT